MDDGGTGSDGPLLTGSDYLAALAREHASLRDEVQSTISSRNASLLAVAAASVGVLAKVYPFQAADLHTRAAHVVLAIVLPILWFAIAFLQAVAAAQTDRAGRAVLLLERKAALLFAQSGPEVLGGLDDALGRELGCAPPPGTRWSSPLTWEHLVRTVPRSYDRVRRRNLLIMGSAAAVSTAGLLVAAAQDALRWRWLLLALAYAAFAVLAAERLHAEYERGIWSALAKPRRK